MQDFRLKRTLRMLRVMATVFGLFGAGAVLSVLGGFLTHDSITAGVGAVSLALFLGQAVMFNALAGILETVEGLANPALSQARQTPSK
jgi:hypothetical protein